MKKSLMLLRKGGFFTHDTFVGIALAMLLLSSIAADKSQAESFCIPGPGDRPETGVHGGVPGFERQPPEGFQGFWCGARGRGS